MIDFSSGLFLNCRWTPSIRVSLTIAQKRDCFWETEDGRNTYFYRGLGFAAVQLENRENM